MKVTSPQVESSQCTRKKVKRRSQELANIRDAISGGQSMTQLQSEVLMLPTEKKQLMREVNFTINIPPECGLPMKADLSIPWNKLRVLRRFVL